MGHILKHPNIQNGKDSGRKTVQNADFWVVQVMLSKELAQLRVTENLNFH